MLRDKNARDQIRDFLHKPYCKRPRLVGQYTTLFLAKGPEPELHLQLD